MKITSNEPSIPFHKVPEGTCFRYYGNYFLKTSKLVRGSYETNAVSMGEYKGIHSIFQDSDLVVPYSNCALS